MFLKILRLSSIFFYFVTNLTFLCIGIYFTKNKNCSLEYDLAVWLIIASLTNLIFGFSIAIIKKYYPKFNFLRLRIDNEALDSENKDLEQNLLSDLETKYRRYEKIAVVIFCVLYFFFLIWNIFGIVISQKTWCQITTLYDITLFELITNIIYLLFSFVLILIKVVAPIFE